MSKDIHVHVHIHPDSSVLAAITQLKELITMNFDEIVTALNAANASLAATKAKLDETNVRFEKGINEVILAIQNSGSVPQAVVDAVDALNANVAAVGTSVDTAAGDAATLDDLNPDAPPTP